MKREKEIYCKEDFIDQTLIDHLLFDRDRSRLWIHNYQWASTLLSGLMGFPHIPAERMTEDNSACLCVCACVHACVCMCLYACVCVGIQRHSPKEVMFKPRPERGR